MNWNNGQLARHSRRSYNNDETRQKQYFAQAKRKKATEFRKRKHSAEDFVPSYLKDLSEKADRPVQDEARHKGSRQKVSTLQNVLETAPQAARYSKSDERIEKETSLRSLTEADVTSIDAKRRRLLQQSDWSGVELQKPVIIRYPEATRSATKIQRRIDRDRLMSPPAKTSKKHIPTNAVIKIASQEYRWSPGGNSIRSWHSKGDSVLPETPIVNRRTLYDISSSTSRSFSSFVPESPCAERALHIGRAKAAQEHSASHTSPSIFDEPPLVKALPATHCFHPQPIRCMPRSICAQLSDIAKPKDVAFDVGQSSPPRLQSDVSIYFAVTESKSGDVVPDTVKGDSSSKISESPREAKQPIIPNRQSLFERNPVLPPRRLPLRPLVEAAYEEEQPDCCNSIPSSITTPDVYRVAEATHTASRLPELPYKRPKLAPTDLGDEDENIMWKRFVLGPGHRIIGESAEHVNPDTPDGKEGDSRSKLGVKPSVLEAPTRIASRLENASPVLDARQQQNPTPAPGGPTPPLTISAEVSYTSMGLSDKTKANSDNEGHIDCREQRNVLGELRIIPAEVQDISQSTVPEVQHMTLKPESTFHPPSLFVGRLAASGSATGSGTMVVPKAKEPEQSGIIPAAKAPSARVMSRRRRNKRREAGRPDIRALPNIQGDPIEHTP